MEREMDQDLIVPGRHERIVRRECIRFAHSELRIKSSIWT